MLKIVKALITLMFIVMLVSAAIAVTLPQWIMIALLTAILLSIIIGIFLMFKNR